MALAGLASIAGGAVVGPEAPLIAVGGGLGLLMMRVIRRAPEGLSALVASSAMFAAISFLFGSPLIAAVLVIEAAGLGGPQLPLVLIPGLIAAGLGSLVSAGLDALTGARAGDIELGRLPLPQFHQPHVVDSCGRSRSPLRSR